MTGAGLFLSLGLLIHLLEGKFFIRIYFSLLDLDIISSLLLFCLYPVCPLLIFHLKLCHLEVSPSRPIFSVQCLLFHVYSDLYKTIRVYPRAKVNGVVKTKVKVKDLNVTLLLIMQGTVYLSVLLL